MPRIDIGGQYGLFLKVYGQDGYYWLQPYHERPTYYAPPPIDYAPPPPVYYASRPPVYYAPPSYVLVSPFGYTGPRY